MQIDEKDRKILDFLKKDARSAIRDIARKTGLRPSSVHLRMQKLKKEGVIEKYTVKLNNKAAGENFIVFLLVKTKPNAAIGDKILGNSHVREVFGVTGEYDLLLKLKFKDIEEFNAFIIGFRKEKGIETTMTMVSTAEIKEEV